LGCTPQRTEVEVKIHACQVQRCLNHEALAELVLVVAQYQASGWGHSSTAVTHDANFWGEHREARILAVVQTDGY